jgi:hypothetical protein
MSLVIPGLARAKRVEETLRVTPFLPIGEEINGIRVRQLTARHLGILIEARSPFFLNTRPDREDILIFLWVVSHAYRPDGMGRAESNRIVAAAPHGARFARAIERYIKRALFDKPPASIGGVVISASYLAGMVHKIAFAYGWPDEVLDSEGLPVPNAGILDKPIARLFQYRKWIVAERDPYAQPQVNPVSDKVRGQWLRRQQPKK